VGELRPDDDYYDARWGYRTIDVRRYEARRYGTRTRQLNFRLLTWRLRQALARVPAGGTVLDVPCGTGVLTSMLASLGLAVTSLDISAPMLAVAAERGAGGRVRADVERLPFASRTFDAVVCNRFLMHLPSTLRPAVLRELCRVSRGPLVVTVCHPYTLKSFGRAIRRSLGLKAKRHERIGMKDIRREAEAAGLRLERVSSVTPLMSQVWVAVFRADEPETVTVPALARDGAPARVA
jgi:ubiquinone/menaquinone biosynthesis C-methylase UbiE